MNEFPVLSSVLYDHEWELEPGRCACGWNSYSPPDDVSDHVDHQSARWREACTIRTVEQLDALPDFTIVGLQMDAEGNRFAIQKDQGWIGVSAILEFTKDELAEALQIGSALLIWHPGWAS